MPACKNTFFKEKDRDFTTRKTQNKRAHKETGNEENS